MKSISILLVDDDEIDVQVVLRALKDQKIANPVQVAGDGIEALEIMRGENGQKKIVEPYMVLLDINMPRMNGFEFLDEIRRDPALRKTVVFVLTTSEADEDIIRAYERNVAGYIVKGKAGDDFLRAAEMLDLYWKLVESPV
ncbi:MAG: response regulator [Rhodospirillales bacterium]